MLKNGIFCKMVILVVFKVFLVVKNSEILIQIVPDSLIYYYCQIPMKHFNKDFNNGSSNHLLIWDPPVTLVLSPVCLREYY